ncbi:hypothetical protein ZYGR_0AM00520 [Zygosaccharomyces rouxii]|uniref:Amine oxidase domain-containing protein n=1 Tax=Zygosaccharomyces rouxii TaxID=4956 RepID=A0A1Q3AFJ6_ZYGRO|nr:hypothetical protein ZYGR_0AM00520 [Zygosaccharomyces rouxii]
MTIKDKTVVIVGAGIAGLKAASKLYEEGVKSCVLLEARDRIGGRLHTVKGYRGRKYDLGGSWHHDTLINRLFAEEANLALQDGKPRFVFDDDSPIYIDSEKGHMEHDGYLRLEVILDEFIKYVYLIFNQNLGVPDCSYKEMIHRYIYEKREFLTDDQIRYLPQLARFVELWHGVDWEMLSGRDSVYDSQGRNAFVLHYESVINRIAQSFPQDWLQLSTPVKSIKRSRGVIVTTDNDEYHCDYAIVTIPQSVLELSLYAEDQPGKIAFEPPLNPRIQEAFGKTHFGSLGKVIFEFEKCTWSDVTTRVVILSHSSVQLAQQVRSADDWSAFWKAADHHEENIKPWDHPLFFLNLPRSTGVPSLVVLMQAPLTQYIESLPNKQLVFEFFEPILNKFMAAMGCSQPVINAVDKTDVKPQNVDSPVLEGIIVTNWSSDPYSRGAYTVCFPGDDAIDMVTAMMNGQDSRIRFAGEHTILDGAGCAYGAWESGVREAEYIRERIL